jgi:hypothetical protein
MPVMVMQEISMSNDKLPNKAYLKMENPWS